MALCASVMAGIYASPVMAGDATVTSNPGSLLISIDNNGDISSNGIYFDRGNNTVFGYVSIAGSNIAEALAGQSLDRINTISANSVTVGGETISASVIQNWNNMARANENVGGITRTPDTATTPGTGTTTIEGVLSVDGTTGEIYNSGSTFGVDAAGNVNAVSVTTSGDVSTGIYTLNTVGADLDTVEQRTQKITYVQSADTTNISGKVIASGVTLNNGNINTNGILVAKEVANASGDTLSGVAGDVDDLTLSVSGVTEDVTELNHKTQNINTTGTYAGTTTFDGNVLADGTIGNGRFMATADGMVSGTNFTTTAGADLNAINQRTSGIEKTAADTKVEGVGFYNGRMDADTVITDSLTVNGLSNLDGVRVQSGSIYATNASNVGGVQLAGGLVDGVDVSELGSNITGVTEDVTELNHKTQNINTTGTYAGTTTFDGNVLADGTIGNGRFMATADGMVSGTNFTTTAGADLNAINQRTSGIEKTAADTRVEGVGFYNGRMDADAVVTDELTVNGLSNLDGVRIQNGSIYAANDSYVGGVQLAGGLVDGVDVSELSTTVGETNKNVAGIVRDGEGAPGEGTTTIEGATSFDANGMNVGNGAVVANTDGNVYATGDVVSSYGDKGYSLNTIGENTQSIKYSDGVTTIGGNTLAVNDNGYVTINNGAFAVGPDGMATVGQNIQLDGENGLITATDLYATSNVYSENYNLEDVGADLADLSGNFAETNANVAGIERFGEGAPGEGITTIEDGALFVSKDITYMNSGDAMVQTSTDSAYMSFGDNMISVNKGGINLVGSVGFTGHDGGRYTLSDLEGRVYDLEQKTQNITSSEPGQGGDPSVPPTTAGETGIVGDVTVGGDLTVNGDGNIGGVGLADGKVTANEGTFNKGTFGSGENQTVIDSNGVTVGTIDENGKGGTSIKHDEITVGDGGYIGGGDVVSGEGTSLNNTADRVTNLEQGVSDLSSKVNELDDRIDKVGAMAAAIANLRTMGYDPAAPTEVAVGIGQYRDETGAALGLFHYPNRDFMLSLSVSTSGDEVMGGIGATWKFGRKSPEKVAEIKKAQAEADVRRAEEAKLAKAEEMKQAAKEAKIKAQQERHAKLAAERAAQAEAAK